MSGTAKRLRLLIRLVVVCPGITEAVDWTLKNQLPTDLPTILQTVISSSAAFHSFVQFVFFFSCLVCPFLFLSFALISLLVIMYCIFVVGKKL